MASPVSSGTIRCSAYMHNTHRHTRHKKINIMCWSLKRPKERLTGPAWTMLHSLSNMMWNGNSRPSDLALSPCFSGAFWVAVVVLSDAPASWPSPSYVRAAAPG
jgi:hypothetical protein